MSLWAKYIEETFPGHTQFIEYDWGFISYSFPEQYPDCVLAEDIYIEPSSRDCAHALQLHSEVMAEGRKRGKTHSLFVVRLDSPRCTENLRIYLAMGFVPCEANLGRILLKRHFKTGGE